jgi:HK97 family phage prohead protease
MEHKQIENAVVISTDEAQGIVEAVWAVMGNVDDGKDVIHPGAFKKTFHERGNQVKLLDNHRAASVMDSLGVVKELREMGQGELPQELLSSYPDATGGAWGQFQFLMDTPEGKGAFTRIQKGAVKGWSFGYDAVDKDHSTITKDGQKIPVRNLRQIKLYEISPVLFAMNEATVTTGTKKKPDEGKPYTVVEEDGEFNVFKVDEDDKPTGKPLGTHNTLDEANAQMQALYAAEEEDDKAVHNDEDEEDKTKWSTAFINNLPDGSFLFIESGGEKDEDGKTTPRSLRHLPYKDSAGNVDLPHLRNAISRLSQSDTGTAGGEKWLTEATRKRLLSRARGILEKEQGKSDDEPSEEKAGRVLSTRNAQRIQNAMNLLHEALASAGLMSDDEDDDKSTGPSKSKETSTSDEAGPLEDDDTRLKLIEIELEEMEV